MSGIWKHNIGLSIFGESHGEVVGITISGLKPGITIDNAFIQSELNRRKPGQSQLTTSRNEADEFQILSGVFNDKTTGAPLTMVIKNTNTRSRDYDGIIDRLRPGHADYTAKVKYKGLSDYRGGGHFSGRLTAGIVFAGAVAKLALKEKGVLIGSQITTIGKIKDGNLGSIVTKEDLDTLDPSFPVLNEMAKSGMKNVILDAKSKLDSVGGKVRCFALNVPVGLGNPYFESFESVLSQLVFSIPAIKGLEFGSGVMLADMKGSEANDCYYEDNGIKTRTNHNGGILGGITNGMPVDFTVTVKPTPSIAQEQESIDYNTKESVKLNIEGRHDPCIVPRVVPVVESVLAITILDLLESI